ncbi:MAG: phosphonoacetaldehyde hydrolase [Gemmataceae bacterium]
MKQGPIRAVFLDWAGTTIDHGSCAPAQVFREIFAREGVEITSAEARGPMGRAKRDHIASILSIPRVAHLWEQVKSRPASDGDVQRLYEQFLPLQMEVLAQHSEVIPGVPEAVEQLRRRGLKIGSSTGYTRALMEVVIPLAAAGGYAPDAVQCAEDARAGRPAPWLNFHLAELLDVYPMSQVIVVDDTPVGIEAGKNAGAITVGITRTGNGMGLSLNELARLDPAERHQREGRIAEELLGAGASFVIPSVADLPRLVEQLEG